MHNTNTADNPTLQNRITTGNDRLANFNEWMAHKQLCRQMFEEAELSLRVSREEYLARLDSVVSLHKEMAKGRT